MHTYRVLQSLQTVTFHDFIQVTRPPKPVQLHITLNKSKKARRSLPPAAARTVSVKRSTCLVMQAVSMMAWCSGRDCTTHAAQRVMGGRVCHPASSLRCLPHDAVSAIWYLQLVETPALMTLSGPCTQAAWTDRRVYCYTDCCATASGCLARYAYTRGADSRYFSVIVTTPFGSRYLVLVTLIVTGSSLSVSSLAAEESHSRPCIARVHLHYNGHTPGGLCRANYMNLFRPLICRFKIVRVYHKYIVNLK